MIRWSSTGSLRDFAITKGGLAVLSELPLLKGLILHKGTSAKPSYPSSIGGLEVTSVIDLTIGYDSANPPTYKPSLPLSSGHMIQFRAASKDGSKITLTTRTSGTEPKVRTKIFSILLKQNPRSLDRSNITWKEVDKTVMPSKGC
jgi:hypothetical protein